ncbi:unnamed protein product, partial [Linum tenue]
QYNLRPCSLSFSFPVFCFHVINLATETRKLVYFSFCFLFVSNYENRKWQLPAVFGNDKMLFSPVFNICFLKNRKQK